ncbi:MAG: glutamine synthetase [Acidimicrobiia bacterium]|nr:glutamine synthetase [Acidimicrobiia bacterium]
MDRQQEYVLRTVEERGVRFIRLWFTDVLGFLKSFAITPQELENAFSEGMHFDGSAIEGFARVQESDMVARPDPNTFALLPWRPDDEPTARMFCDIVLPDGSPFEGDPRWVLRRNLQRATEAGFTFFVAPEMEYFLFAGPQDPTPLDTAGYFDLTPSDEARGLRRRTIEAVEAMGIPVEYSHHEVGPSQHEIDLRYADALMMADSIMTFRLTVKQVAESAGVYATFMPKPLTGEAGSAMHTHQSLFEGDQNAFFDPADEYGLSKVGKGYVAGLLTHAREMAAITNQWVNSYKRLATGYEAPTFVCWGRHNRSALVRVPRAKPGKEQAARIEFRAPDSACNPYLAFAVMLAAGMRGVEEGYELPPEASDNIYEMSPEERRASGLRSLPSSLMSALEEMERSELMAEALGEHVFEWFLRNKREEWQSFRAKVTPYEIERYLPQL